MENYIFCAVLICLLAGKLKMSKSYAFIVMPLQVSNELIKLSGINYFGKKVNTENFQENFSGKVQWNKTPPFHI